MTVITSHRRLLQTRRGMFVLVPTLVIAAIAVAVIGVHAQAGAKSATLEKARYFGQCEIFLLKGKPGNYEGEVYNTTPLNDCPPTKFDPIDAKQVAKQTGWDVAWKNPRRFWTMDRLTIALVGEPREFDGLMFNFVAKMAMPPAFTLEGGQQSISFRPTQIQRNSTYEFLQGQPVFLLQSPDGKTWVMQTYTTHTDASLTAADLPNLAGRLKLPAGWQFKSRTLEKNLVISTNGLARIVPDNLENMYQGCIDGVCNFDPWQ